MNDYSEYFNPELEAILQEIARDPRAKLLKVPSSGALIWATKQPRVGIAAPGLTFAERELLTVHRDELAERLKERCLIEFYMSPGADPRLGKSVSVGRSVVVRSVDSWNRDAENLLNLGDQGEDLQLASDVLRKCVETEKQDRPISITQLAIAMMRVVPKEQGPIYMALDLCNEGRHLDAIERLRRFLRDKPSPLLAAYAFDTIAVAFWRMGRMTDALSASLDAMSATDTRISSVLSCLDLAVRVGAIDEAEDAAKRLDGFGSSESSVVSWFANLHEPASLLVRPSLESRRQVQNLLKRVGEQSKVVLNAILS